MSELSVLKNIVRTGWVSSVNKAERTARVTFKDKGQTFVSGPLKVIKTPPFTPDEVKTAPWLPSPGDYVLCLYIATGDGDGFVIGGI